MKYLTLILSTAVVLLFTLQTKATAKVSFDLLTEQYSKAANPAADELLSHTWGFVAVVSNPHLSLNQGQSDRVDYIHGLKNADGSQLYLWFRNDGPQSLFPFLSLDRYNNFSANNALLFNRVDQDQQNKYIRYLYDAGAHDGALYENQCRLSSAGQEQYLLCQVIFRLSEQPAPIYLTPKYQEAKDKTLVFQVFKRDLK
jgi:hypothetical protein